MAAFGPPPILAHVPSNGALPMMPPIPAGRAGPGDVEAAVQRQQVIFELPNVTAVERGQAAIYTFEVTQDAVVGECS